MKFISTLTTGLSLLLVIGCNDKGSLQKEVLLSNDIDSMSYSLGLNVAENVKSQGLTEINADAIAIAISDVMAGQNTMMTTVEAEKYLNDYFKNLAVAKLEADKQAGMDYLEQNKTQEGVITLPSGLQYKIITEGSGPKPDVKDKVTTHYHGTTIDGVVFDSSVDRGEPASFAVNGVIEGWTEALQLMNVGSKWKLFIPSGMAYGTRGAGPLIGPNATLIFEVELLAIEK